MVSAKLLLNSKSQPISPWSTFIIIVSVSTFDVCYTPEILCILYIQNIINILIIFYKCYFNTSEKLLTIS